MVVALLAGVITTLISIPLLAKGNLYFQNKGYAPVPNGVLAALCMILGGAVAVLVFVLTAA